MNSLINMQEDLTPKKMLGPTLGIRKVSTKTFYTKRPRAAQISKMKK